MPRTGSTMVVAWLNTHPDIFCLPAILSPKGWPRWSTYVTAQGDRIPHPLANLADQWSDVDYRFQNLGELLALVRARFPNHARLGFKQHVGRIDREETMATLATGWPRIMLTRPNMLAAYSSEKIAKMTGQGSVAAGREVRKARPEFIAEEFDDFYRWRQNVDAYWLERISADPIPWMQIEYLEARTMRGMEKIVAFLGLTVGGLDGSPTKKRNSDNIVERFANPDAAFAFLEKNGLAEWASEDVA